MNRCVMCGRKLKNSETTCGIEFCKVCEKYEQQLQKLKEDNSKLRKILNFAECNAGIDIKEMWADMAIEKQKENNVLNETLRTALNLILRMDCLGSIEEERQDFIKVAKDLLGGNEA